MLMTDKYPTSAMTSSIANCDNNEVNPEVSTEKVSLFFL
jgi:hypothetical protein